MCGIFGAIGKRINPGTIRALAIINRERGTDSLGFFSNTGKFVKRADDPVVCLADDDFADFIDKSCCKGWFLAGHTRAATAGAVTNNNAHPFRFGRIIGCHNGIVSAPKSYSVDSEFLFDSLNKAGGDYNTAFADIAGYWALSWFDGESFYLQSHKNEVAIGRDAYGVWYYSSDWKHLEACARIVDNFTLLGHGDTIRFTIKTRKFQIVTPFRSRVVTMNSREKRKARRAANKAVKGTIAEKRENAENACNTDPFYYDDDERWAGVDDYSNYVRDYN